MTATAIAFDPAFIQRISTARPAEMTAMLLEEAVRALQESIQAIHAGDIQDRFNSSARAMKVVGFLHETLNFEDGGDVAVNLDRIYRIAMARITRINPFNDAEAAYAAINVLRPQAEAWRELDHQESLMDDMPKIETAPHIAAAAVMGPHPMHVS